jgi:ribosomal protein S27AE
LKQGLKVGDLLAADLAEHDGKLTREVKQEYDDLGFLKRLLCPNCGSEALKLSHVDDVGIEWFKCEKCGSYCTKNKAKEKMELEDVLAKPKTVDLVFEGEGKKITILQEDGIRVPAGQLWFKAENEFLIGELTYCYAQVERLHDDGKAYETIIPVLVWSRFKDGMLVERDLKPYSLARKLEVGGKPVLVELRTRYSGTLDTLISLETAKAFIEGSAVPEWGEIFSSVKEAISKFICFDWDQRLLDVAACWVVGTYFAEVFPAFPFLYPHGTQGSGKTRLLKTVVYLARHGFVVTDPSDASLFRMAEAFKPTLGIDESLLGSTAWKLIRTAFKRGLYVPRVEKTGKEEFLLALFETYMPVAFSATEMPKDLGGCEADEARAIFIFMQRMPDPSGRDPEPWDFKREREKLYLLRLTKANEVLATFKTLENSELFYGHEREIWIPLLTIAKVLGEDVFKNVLEYAFELYGIKQARQYGEERIITTAILRMFQSIYQQRGKEHIEFIEFKSSDLMPFVRIALEETGEFEEAFFTKYWTTHRVGRILTRLSIFKKLRSGRSHYMMTPKKLRELYKVFYGGLGGLSGLVSRVVKAEDKSTTPMEKPTFKMDLGGFLEGKTTFKSNPPNPPNPPCERCGGYASTVIVREDGEHWLCGKCLMEWEGNL